MIILINGGSRSPTSTDLDALAKSCGTKDWHNIGLALGDRKLTEIEQLRLSEAVFDFIAKTHNFILSER